MTPNGVGSRAQLVLASASPRRRQILESLGIIVRCLDVDVDETPRPGESPSAMVARLAEAKAKAGLAMLEAERAGYGDGVVVIGADTTVALGEESLGKPVDDGDARAMLRRLSGRSHQVLSGVAVAVGRAGGEAGGRCETRVDGATVYFRVVDEAEISAYVASGEPRGKAGAYAIQGRGGLFVPRIEGSYAAVVGLPVVVLDELCRGVAGRPLGSWASDGSGGGGEG
ncbi:MAG: Maf family protein [Acidimicrobiia bacterium]|nr:Maf family protein [Acidimicrobiia bacterium]MDH5288530.1 Maf family protein [Acidimicrobiia bacterium]